MIKVAISVKGGLVQNSYVSGGNDGVELYVIDWDDIETGRMFSISGEPVEHVSKIRFEELIKEANDAIEENRYEME